MSYSSGFHAALARNSRSLEITDWLLYFSHAVLSAQRRTHESVLFLIGKARLYARIDNLLNARQRKVLERMLAAGVDGFEGGMSAEKYMRITQASRATATRDLQALVQCGALHRTGERRHTRYHLRLPLTSDV